jgi:hypothetical protein
MKESLDFVSKPLPRLTQGWRKFRFISWFYLIFQALGLTGRLVGHPHEITTAVFRIRATRSARRAVEG